MQQITGNIFQISLGAVNTFLVEDNGLTLIDTGNKNSTDKIFAVIKKGGKNPADIKQVILTHCHPDHTGSAAEIKRRLNIPVFANIEEATLIERGMGIRKPMYLSPGIINRIVYNIFIKKTPQTIEPVNIDEKLEDNDVIPFAGGIHVIHTPGHCAGHIALLTKNEGVLIAGDICANAAGLGTSTVNEDPDLSIKSILKAAAFSFDKAVFGHGSLLKNSASQKLKEKFIDAKSYKTKTV